ncbi:hypothetical protein AOLI_G00112470 [Acnodon oligacanthus]
MKGTAEESRRSLQLRESSRKVHQALRDSRCLPCPYVLCSCLYLTHETGDSSSVFSFLLAELGGLHRH